MAYGARRPLLPWMAAGCRCPGRAARRVRRAGPPDLTDKSQKTSAAVPLPLFSPSSGGGRHGSTTRPCCAAGPSQHGPSVPSTGWPSGRQSSRSSRACHSPCGGSSGAGCCRPGRHMPSGRRRAGCGPPWPGRTAGPPWCELRCVPWPSMWAGGASRGTWYRRPPATGGKWPCLQRRGGGRDDGKRHDVAHDGARPLLQAPAAVPVVRGIPWALGSPPAPGRRDPARGRAPAAHPAACLTCRTAVVRGAAAAEGEGDRGGQRGLPAVRASALCPASARGLQAPGGSARST